MRPRILNRTVLFAAAVGTALAFVVTTPVAPTAVGEIETRHLSHTTPLPGARHVRHFLLRALPASTMNARQSEQLGKPAEAHADKVLADAGFAERPLRTDYAPDQFADSRDPTRANITTDASTSEYSVLRSPDEDCNDDDACLRFLDEPSTPEQELPLGTPRLAETPRAQDGAEQVRSR